MFMALAACNTAPLDYRNLGRAPASPVPWSGPGDQWCSDKPNNAEQVGPFLLCGGDGKTVIPVDDPVMVACDDPEARSVAPEERVAFVYDGVEARAYPLGRLEFREGVHDLFHGIPVFVDW